MTMWTAATAAKPPSRVLILGGTGFIGAEIAREFLRAGSTVVILARREPCEQRLAELAGAELVLSDVADSLALSALLDRVDHVVYAVGSILPKESNANPALDLTTTMPAILSLLELLRQRPGVALTQISSGGTVYGNAAAVPVSETTRCDPLTSYGIVKLTAEKYIAMYAALHGLAGRVLRVGNAYGPLQPAGRSQGLIGTLLAAARDRLPARVFGDGAMVRDYVHVDDIAYAAVELSRRPDGPSVVNVGTGVGRSVLDVVDVVGRVTGAPLAVERVPDRGFDVRTVVLDVSVLSGLIAWDPIPLEIGIARSWRGVLARTEPTAQVA